MVILCRLWLNFDPATRTFSGTPDDPDIGSMSVKITLSDGVANTDVFWSLDVIAVNDAPEALNGTLSATEDGGEIVGQLSAIDFDNGDTLTFSVENQPGEGSVTINADGSYSFNPGSDFQDLADGATRDVTFDYRVTDSQGDSSTATVTVTVTGINDVATFTSAESTSEDFNSLNSGNLGEQDGWVTEQFGSSVDLNVANVGFDGSDALQFSQVSASASASKLNTIPDLSNAHTLVFEVDLAKNYWGTTVGIGADNNADGKIGRNDNELAIAIKPSDVNDQLELQLADGSTQTVAFPVADGNAWASYRVEIDLNANSGAGAVTVKYKDLVAGDSEWNTVSGLENISAGLNPSGSDQTNPDNWNGVYIWGDGAGVRVDNLTLEALSDTTTRNLSEDSDVDGSNNLSLSGTIIVSDADIGESSITAETITGTYGSLVVDAAGSWTYTADNTQNAIQSLGDGESLTENLNVRSADGTIHSVDITIHGTNDAPVISTPTPSEQLLNGSFEVADGTSDANPVITGGDAEITLPGWSILGGVDLADDSAFGDPDAYAWSAGDQFIDLLGNNSGANGFSSNVRLEGQPGYTPSGIEQTVSTTPGNVYELSFDYTGHVVQGQAAELFINGEFVEEIVFDSGSAFDRHTFTHTFEGSGSDTIRLMASVGANGGGLLVDNLSLKESETHLLSEDGSLVITEAELLANASDIDGDDLSVSNVRVGSGSASVADNGDGTWTVTPAPNWSGAGELLFDVTDGHTNTASQVDLIVTPVADSVQLSIGARLQSDPVPTTTADQDFSGLSEGIQIDLASSEAQMVASGENSQIYDVTSVTGTAYDDVFSFGNAQNGEVFTVDGGAGSNTLDLSGFAASDVTLTNTSAVVDLGNSESFTINFSHIDQITFDRSKTDGDPHAVETISGDWTVNGTSLSVNSDGTDQTLILIGYEGSLNENFTLSTTVVAHATEFNQNGRIIFDYIDSNNYKFVQAHVKDDRWSINEVADGVKTELTLFAQALEAETPVNLTMIATGGLVELVDGNTVLASHDFGSPVNSGQIGVGTGRADTDFILNIQPSNWAPDVEDYDLTLDVEDIPIITANVLADAVDADGDPLSITSFTQGSNGSVADNGDGSFTYTPTNGFMGIDSFTYTISDGQNTSTGTVRVNVTDTHNVTVSSDATAIDLDISAALSDADGSETLTINIGGVADGAVITDGVNTFTGTSGNGSVDISNWQLGSVVLTTPDAYVGNFDLVVTATSTDGADSQTTSSAIHILNPLEGTSGDDILNGISGTEAIVGGAGNDILTGGESSDTFIWHAGDDGTAETPAEDTITDFHIGQGGDIIDLSDVLVDEENHQLDEYLHFNFDNGDTTVEISTQAGGDVTQKVTLQGVDLSGLGASDSEIINNLLNDGNLQIDN